MSSTWSSRWPFRRTADVFCDEPWTGLFSVAINLDVTFCPCYLNMRLGNLEQASLAELWNAQPLQDLRRSFAAGKLPVPCKGQLCPVATSARHASGFDARRLALKAARPVVQALRAAYDTVRPRRPATGRSGIRLERGRYLPVVGSKTDRP